MQGETTNLSARVSSLEDIVRLAAQKVAEAGIEESSDDPFEGARRGEFKRSGRPSSVSPSRNRSRSGTPRRPLTSAEESNPYLRVWNNGQRMIEKREERLSNLRGLQRERELSEATFSPALSSQTRKKTPKRTNSPSRPYEDGRYWSSVRNEALELQRRVGEAMELRHATFKPSINENTDRLLQQAARRANSSQYTNPVDGWAERFLYYVASKDSRPAKALPTKNSKSHSHHYRRDYPQASQNRLYDNGVTSPYDANSSRLRSTTEDSVTEKLRQWAHHLPSPSDEVVDYVFNSFDQQQSAIQNDRREEEIDNIPSRKIPSPPACGTLGTLLIRVVSAEGAPPEMVGLEIWLKAPSLQPSGVAHYLNLGQVESIQKTDTSSIISFQRDVLYPVRLGTQLTPLVEDLQITARCIAPQYGKRATGDVYIQNLTLFTPHDISVPIQRQWPHSPETMEVKLWLMAVDVPPDIARMALQLSDRHEQDEHKETVMHVGGKDGDTVTLRGTPHEKFRVDLSDDSPLAISRAGLYDDYPEMSSTQRQDADLDEDAFHKAYPRVPFPHPPSPNQSRIPAPAVLPLKDDTQVTTPGKGSPPKHRSTPSIRKGEILIRVLSAGPEGLPSNSALCFITLAIGNGPIQRTSKAQPGPAGLLWHEAFTLSLDVEECSGARDAKENLEVCFYDSNDLMQPLAESSVPLHGLLKGVAHEAEIELRYNSRSSSQPIRIAMVAVPLDFGSVDRARPVPGSPFSSPKASTSGVDVPPPTSQLRGGGMPISPDRQGDIDSENVFTQVVDILPSDDGIARLRGILQSIPEIQTRKTSSPPITNTPDMRSNSRAESKQVDMLARIQQLDSYVRNELSQIAQYANNTSTDKEGGRNTDSKPYPQAPDDLPYTTSQEIVVDSIISPSKSPQPTHPRHSSQHEPITSPPRKIDISNLARPTLSWSARFGNEPEQPVKQYSDIVLPPGYSAPMNLAARAAARRDKQEQKETTQTGRPPPRAHPPSPPDFRRLSERSVPQSPEPEIKRSPTRTVNFAEFENRTQQFLARKEKNLQASSHRVNEERGEICTFKPSPNENSEKLFFNKLSRETSSYPEYDGNLRHQMPQTHDGRIAGPPRTNSATTNRVTPNSEGLLELIHSTLHGQPKKTNGARDLETDPNIPREDKSVIGPFDIDKNAVDASVRRMLSVPAFQQRYSLNAALYAPPPATNPNQDAYRQLNVEELRWSKLQEYIPEWLGSDSLIATPKGEWPGPPLPPGLPEVAFTFTQNSLPRVHESSNDYANHSRVSYSSPPRTQLAHVSQRGQLGGKDSAFRSANK